MIAVLSLDHPGWRILFTALFLLLADVDGAIPAAERPADSEARKKRDLSDEFFTNPAVPLFKLEVPEAGLNGLRGNPRAYVRGTFSAGHAVLTNVGVHLKGMGSFRPVDDKPSFAVKFDEFSGDQEYCGLTKLMLNNSAQDSSYAAESLATGLFREAGVPAARVTHARVVLNGRDLGLYVVIEAMNNRFLKRHFKNTRGNLYEGYLLDVDERLEQDGGEQTDQADVKSLFAAAKIDDPAERFHRLSQVLDVDRFVSFVAMEMLVSHWDGYGIHTNNYRIYHDPTADRLVFITHGLDGVFRRPNISIQPPLKSIVGRGLFQTPEGRALYNRRIGELFTNVFRLETITNRLNAAWVKFRSAGLKPGELAELENNVATMRQRIVQRAQRVGEQLAGIEPPVLKFDSQGFARLGGWREEPDIGTPRFDRPLVDGKPTLHIDAGNRACRASWRLGIYLKPGRYQFQGLVRTRGLLNGGAGLRISGDTRNRRIARDAPWTSLSHDFVLEEGAGDVELVGELRSYQGGGEVWFDLESLKLRRF